LSQGHLSNRADNKEEREQDSEASSEKRYVPLSCLDAACSYCILMTCMFILLIGWKHVTRMATLLCLLHDIALVLIEPVFCKTMLAAAVSFACVTLTVQTPDACQMRTINQRGLRLSPANCTSSQYTLEEHHPHKTTPAGIAANSRSVVYSATAQHAPCMFLPQLSPSICHQHYNKKPDLCMCLHGMSCMMLAAIHCPDLHPYAI